MEPKIMLVTGGTSGIGKQTAVQLAGKGYQVIITARNKEKGIAAVEEIKALSGTVGVNYLTADLSLLKSVKELAVKFKEQYARLDGLIHNAGVWISQRELTEEGLEKTFATNHLAPFLLTNALRENLEQAPGARIVTVSSAIHYQGSLEWDNLQGEKNYGVLKSYANSKLLNVLFTMELARRLEGTKLTANCLHPGVVRTALGNKNANSFLSGVWSLFAGLGGISEKKGARTSVYLASSPEVEGVSGKYFDACKVKTPAIAAMDRDAAKRLWEISAEICGLTTH